MINYQPGEWYARLATDLASAYLGEYGSRRDLARALGVSEAFITYVLPKSTGYSKRLVPSDPRARQIADVLCTDAERREALLGFWVAARGQDRRIGGVGEELSEDEVQQRIATLGELHSWTYLPDPVKAGFAYVQIHRDGWAIFERISALKYPFARVQLLLYLHDVDSVLNRPDLALFAARQAGTILEEARPHPREVDRYRRLQVNVCRAEAVALNNLGLPVEARAVTAAAEHLPDAVSAEGSAFWTPHLLGDHLSSLRRMRRVSVNEVQNLHARGMRYADDLIRVVLENRLADALVIHGSRPSLRKARTTVEAQMKVLESDRHIPPLHRALTLRTAVRVATALRDEPRRDELLAQTLALATSAGLVHQIADMRREFGDELVDRAAASNYENPHSRATSP